VYGVYLRRAVGNRFQLSNQNHFAETVEIHVPIVFLPLIETLTKIINHTNKETDLKAPHPVITITGKKPVIFARWVLPNIWLRLFNIPP
jgi:hypothetical protein